MGEDVSEGSHPADLRIPGTHGLREGGVRSGDNTLEGKPGFLGEQVQKRLTTSGDFLRGA